MVAHPRDADTFWVIPLSQPEEGRFMPDGAAGGLADARSRRHAGSAVDAGLPTARRLHVASCARRWRATRSTRSGVTFGTETGQLWHSSDEGDSWRLITDNLPEIWAVEAVVRRRAERRVATVLLPRSLLALFPGVEQAPRGRGRRRSARSSSRSTQRCPGMRDRLVEGGPRLRPHINVFVDGRPADLATPVGDGATVHVIPAVSGG